jgi:hypothetical protein
VREKADRTENSRVLPSLLRSGLHSSRFFGGMRERVLERDRFRCRACGARSRLLVHHRDRSNEPNFLVTVCIRCHIRIHRSLGVRYWLSGMLLKLWRELHQHDPMQLQLALRFVAKKDGSEHLSEQGRSVALAPFFPRNAKRDVPAPRTISAAPAALGPGGGSLEVRFGWPIQSIAGNLPLAFDGTPSVGVRSRRSRGSMRRWSRSEGGPPRSGPSRRGCGAVS